MCFRMQENWHSERPPHTAESCECGRRSQAEATSAILEEYQSRRTTFRRESKDRALEPPAWRIPALACSAALECSAFLLAPGLVFETG